MFTKEDYAKLYSLFEDPSYQGYKPNVLELPNGDGNLDAGKRYLHVAKKYNPPPFSLSYLAEAHFEASRMAQTLGVPSCFLPDPDEGVLRVLDYPPGAGSAEHTDFDLFTILCYRSTPEDLVLKTAVKRHHGSPLYNIGEIGEIAGLGPATPHSVSAREYAQQSIVYFAMPSPHAILPEHGGIGGVRWFPGQTVKDWVSDRYSRSRSYK